MHFLGNFARTLWKITYNDAKKGRPHHEGQSYCLPKTYWDKLSDYVASMVVPSVFGRFPRTPNTPGSFKSIEWKFFLFNFMIPLLYAANVDIAFLKPLAGLIGDLKFLFDKTSTTKESLLQCQESIISNFSKVENYIVSYNPENPTPGKQRLDFCTSNNHLILHLVECFTKQGPLYVYSQWMLESKLGKLRDYVFTRSKPEENLVKNIKTFTQIQSIGSAARYCMTLFE